MSDETVSRPNRRVQTEIDASVLRKGLAVLAVVAIVAGALTYVALSQTATASSTPAPTSVTCHNGDCVHNSAPTGASQSVQVRAGGLEVSTASGA